ncbi:MAG TPA: GNAT family N-acetyltransferase [Burkholderiales bacterium]|nr:GNAT family N-acetyltransferase [Burkholderiales bacterium]
MASTEHALGEEHLPGCLKLSRSANWNQNEADWRLMLGFGRGWGITTADGTLAASTVALPYGAGFAWIAMVLVLPEHRRQGYASRLLRVALAAMASQLRVSLLDATPAGHDVYVQEGFRDFWGFKRFALSLSHGKFTGEGTVPLKEAHWPQIFALDADAFGGSREAVLRNLADRQPGMALVAERNGAIAGFVLAREGREALQVGPLVARDEETARRLLGAALAKARLPVYVDITDRAASLQAWALAQGFAIQRPFTRMAHGPGGYAPGDASLVFCPAGPELG